MLTGNTTIIIAGATGDLTQHKLLPSLYRIWKERRIPLGCRILGLARSELTDDGFREQTRLSVTEEIGGAPDPVLWDRFASHLYYTPASVSVEGDMLRAKERLEGLEAEFADGPPNRLFYLSLAPDLYGPTIANIRDTGLVAPAAGWRRIVIEKPFGKDLESARDLNRLVQSVFPEHGVYRIDHYLGKETVQNLLVLRFGNAIFEPLWNRNYVDNVQITVSESDTVGLRGGYYDGSGVVRDMVQNHLIQILAMIAMEPPNQIDAESLRSKKVDLLKSVRRWKPEEAMRHAVLGQYEGYRQEKGVRPGSQTPTYVALRLFIDNWRWQGVPFYLRTGKALPEKRTEVAVQFRCPPQLLFAEVPSHGETAGGGLHPNVLSICIQPDEGAHLRIEAKFPGEGMRVAPVDMEFHYQKAFRGGPLPDAYDRLLQDALEGDPALFIRSDQAEEAWRIVAPLLDTGSEASHLPLRRYTPGSWGPDAADALLAQEHHDWLSMCGLHMPGT